LVNKLIQRSNITTDDTVIEIGAGKGIITRALGQRCKKVIAYELDENLFGSLRFGGNIELVNQDFLTAELPQKPYKVFSNIPFNLTADIISKLLMAENAPDECYLIMQREAVFKLTSNNLRSLGFAPFYNIKIMHRFAKTDFYPIPKVETVLARFQKKTQNDVNDTNSWRDFIAFVFSAKGKTLKEKTSKIFTYGQQKRLNITAAVKITDWTYPQWLCMFRCFTDLVIPQKKLRVKGAHEKLLAQQLLLTKRHRSKQSCQ